MTTALPLPPTLTRFWKEYNAEDSFLPFYYPFVFWAASYIYCQLPTKLQLQIRGKYKTADDDDDDAKKESSLSLLPWHEWHELHNIHNMGAVILAAISLYINDDTIFNERIVILWNWSYFVIDLIDTASRLDIPYVLHAICCLGLGAFNYTTPLCRTLRMNSKACLLETSSPFLHVAKRTKNPIHFLLFAFAFTICRIVWIPIMIYQLRKHGMDWTDIRVLIVIGFYGLNLFWYSKIVKIIVDAAMGKEDPSGKKKDDSKDVVEDENKKED